MSSTQKLTQLPTIQYTGMDYSSVLSEIQNIIDNNKNWKSNWTQFYNSEAGTMLVQLMSWICDNLAIRQDLIYNENYLATATSDSSKQRLLKQIGYFLSGTNGSKVKVAVEINSPTTTDDPIYLSNYRKDINDVTSILNNILRFTAPDINGKKVSWEILALDNDEKIKYKESVTLKGNSTYYTEFDRNGVETPIYAIQGETKYTEFTSSDFDGVVFNFGLKTFDTDSISVFDLTDSDKTENYPIRNGVEHIRVNSFQDLVVMSSKESNEYENVPCYILERDDYGYLQIRYPNKEIMGNNKNIEKHGFKPGHKIGVFYRTSNGTDGNIVAGYMNSEVNIKTSKGKTISAKITNTLSAFGGRENESIESAIQTAPLSLRNNDRAVTIEDFDRVLQKNALVSNSTSYSPDNEPKYFKNYYGRNIYPHEVFSFISSNKNFANVPTDRLNYFPWIDTIKESVMNEYYNFFECEINKPFNIFSKSFGGLLIKNVDENSRDEDIYVNLDSRKGIIQKNSVVYKTSLDIGSKINAEFNDNESNTLKVKFHTTKFKGQYIKDISNDLFGRMEDQDFTFTAEYEVVEKDENTEIRKPIKNCIEDSDNYSATFTSKKIDLSKEIDIAKYSKFNVVFDDNLTLEVDLKAENDFSKYLEAFGISGSESDVTSYYLMFDNNPDTNIYSLLGNKSSELYNKLSSLGSKEDLISYYNGSDISKYRKGILQLCIEAWEKFKDKENEYDPRVKKEVSDDLLNLERIKGNIQYADLGLQYPEFFLGSDTYIREDAERFPFFREVDNDMRHYYTVKINGELYAFAIDEKAVVYASEFYDSQRKGSDNRYYDVFKYIGFGPTFDNNIAEESWEKYKEVIEIQLKNDPSFIAAINEKAIEILREKNGGNYTPEELEDTKRKLMEQAINDFVDGLDNSSYHVKLEGNYSYQVMPEQTANFFRTIEGTYQKDLFWLTLDRLAALLEFEISPNHRYPYVLLRYDNIGNEWVDSKDDKINGNYKLNDFRVSVAKKIHHTCNSVSPKYPFDDNEYLYKTIENKDDNDVVIEKITNYSSGNFEYDLRFENILPKDDNNYISIESTNDDEDKKIIGVDSIIFKDLFTELFGKKKFINRKFNSNSYLKEEDEIFSIKFLKDGYHHFVIKTPTVGKYGSISLYGNDTIENCFVTNEIGGTATVKKLDKNNYFWYTNKAYGIRKLEMFVDKFEETYLFKNTVSNEKIVTIQSGDFIFTDNDINLFNAPTQVFISYKSNERDSIPINIRNNFCYINNNGEEISYEEYCENQGIEELVSMEGGIYYTDDENNIKMNKIGSDFALKITKNPVNTNNFYTIDEDSLLTLNSVRSNIVSITTGELHALNLIGAENNNIPDDEDLEQKEQKDIPMPFKIGYDVPEILIDNETSNPLYEVSFIIYNTNKFNSNRLYDYMQSEMQNKSEIYSDEQDLKFEQNLYEQRKIVCRYAKDNSNKLVFTNFNRNNGNIVFYYPSDKEISDYKVTDTNVSLFYKTLFGTNKTNENLYKLYPRDCMDENVIVEGEDGEYWYSPRIGKDGNKHNVIFKYRYYEGEDLLGNPVSRYADYYIEAIETNPKRSINSGKGSIYEFYINKTKTSNFPDTGFYLHYMHDRSALNEPQLEENIIQKYMQKYMIAGTDINILKPYFKTFDIEAKIYFNANYDEEVIKTNLENLFKAKYQINNIKNIVIGNKIYLSDITMMMMSVTGIEHVEITYFGFDATDKDNNPTQTKYLSSGEDKDFYTMVVLASNSRTHGLLFSYEKNQE